MTRRIWMLVLVLAVALVVTTFGWIRSSDRVRLFEDKPARFESCAFDGHTLELGYLYGANQLVSPSIDTRPDNKIVVELRTRAGEGATVAIGLGGLATFSVFGADEDTVIEYTDGKVLECEREASP